MKKQLTVKITPEKITGLLFALFFCDDIFAAVVGRVFGGRMVFPLYSLCFLTLLILALAIFEDKESLMVPLLIYFCVFLLFLITSLIHPEYNDWFSHPVYGVVPSLLSPRSGIWAFLIVWLVRDECDMYSFMKFSVWALFIFYTLQFVVSTARGYWIIHEIDGTIRRDGYNLEFGYNLLFPVAFFGGNCFLQSKKPYIIPYVMGTVMIFMGGSRGAAIWPIAMLLLILPFKWKNMEKNKRIWFIMLLFALLTVAAIIYVNYKVILLGLTSILARYGISSRTLSSLVAGSFSDTNGRDHIFALAIDLIKKGGLFGHGVYGDRYTIGNYFRWGYSHNIFLELLVSFGYIGGGVAIIALIIGIVRLYKNCDSLKKQVVFITFLITSCKLMLSNSFWYTAAFWAILALCIKWEKTHKLRLNVRME